MSFSSQRISQQRDVFDGLPSPEMYYDLMADLPSGMVGSGAWRRAVCPFHESATRSKHLAINVEIGCFKCHSCGASGGDIIKFHMLLRGLSWREAVKDLRGAY